jgi:hypothetical protein
MTKKKITSILIYNDLRVDMYDNQHRLVIDAQKSTLLQSWAEALEHRGCDLQGARVKFGTENYFLVRDEQGHWILQ